MFDVRCWTFVGKDLGSKVFLFDVGRSMFDVGRSSVNPDVYALYGRRPTRYRSPGLNKQALSGVNGASRGQVIDAEKFGKTHLVFLGDQV